MSYATTNDGCRLHWIEKGAGRPVLLIHGYISDIERNWRSPGWIEALTKGGFRVIAYDQRGHGKSDKRYDPTDYAPARLLEDACTVLDAASVEQAIIIGYSMGARIALHLGLFRPERGIALVLGGIGKDFPDFGGPEPDREVVARALEADDRAEIPESARGYRTFAKRGGADLKAMAACYRQLRRRITPQELAKIFLPTLLLVGELDGIAGDAEPLARAIPGAKLVKITGKDHMKAVGAKESRAAVLAFLEDLKGVGRSQRATSRRKKFPDRAP